VRNSFKVFAQNTGTVMPGQQRRALNDAKKTYRQANNL
jgi:inhibitor of KinA sporulation pathway (predicted exonuclease)